MGYEAFRSKVRKEKNKPKESINKRKIRQKKINWETEKCILIDSTERYFFFLIFIFLLLLRDIS